MAVLDLKDILQFPDVHIDKKISVQGWIRSHRKQKNYGFINFYDGTLTKDIQVVYDDKLLNFADIQALHIGSAITINGKLVRAVSENQAFEIFAEEIIIEGISTEDYPIQPKKHTLEYLREIGHLRPRTKLMQAIFRIRSLAAYAIHKYFKDKGYVYLNSPLITANDGEGAGETFQVTTLDLDKIKHPIDYSKDFFGKKTSLAVTGQLEAECFALAFKKVYTFGPCFRAENSNTKTHLAELWMIEPEIAFCDIEKLMSIQEDFIKYIVKYILVNARSEMDILDKFTGKNVKPQLEALVDAKMTKITHKQAVDILIAANKDWEIKPQHGKDLAREHERYLTDEFFTGPVFVYDWPKEIKAFYMRVNDDNKTVAGVDLLVPFAGELMGGSQREERLDLLIKRMDDMNVGDQDLKWYLDLRKYGGCKHSGFGMGFDRLLLYLTGIENIRDVIPFARTPKNCEY